MRFKIVGANSETGDDVDVMLEAPSQSEVERLAHEKNILVSSITPLGVERKHDPEPIALIDDEPVAVAVAEPPHASHAGTAHGTQVAHPGNGTHAGHPAQSSQVGHPAQGSQAGHPAQGSQAGAPVDGAHPAAPGEHHERAHGVITVNASSPSDTAHSGEGHIPETKHGDAAIEYHIIMNQSLYLLESTVNKHARDGWEPQGGLTVGMSNNAMQYFQAMIRRKKT